MSNSTERISMNELGSTMRGMLKQLTEKNAVLVAEKTKWLSLRFKNEAMKFYPESPLKVKSGNLRRSIQRFTRRSAAGIEVGLRNKMAYAKYLEYGTARHQRQAGVTKVRKGKNKGLIRYTRAHTSGGIKARMFLSTPIKTEGGKIIDELVKEIGF